MKKLLAGFSIGCVTGAAGAYLLTAEKPEDHRDTGRLTEVRTEASAGAQSEILQERNTLRAENARLIAAAASADPPAVEAQTEKIAIQAFLEMAMERGKEQGKSEIEARINQLKVRLNLTDAQADVVRQAMLERLRKKDEAAARIMSGTASIADLVAADEDNFAGIDATVAALLDDAQRAEYDLLRSERERSRVEKKTNEDLENLRKVAYLTEAQQDQAWQVLVDLNAGDPPGDIPEGTTKDDVLQFIGMQFDKRGTALDAILTPEQHEAYVKQLATNREFLVDLISSGLGGVRQEK